MAASPTKLPSIPQDKIGESFVWREWFDKLNNRVYTLSAASSATGGSGGTPTTGAGNFTTLVTSGNATIGCPLATYYNLSVSGNITGNAAAAGQINNGLFQNDVVNGSLFQTRAQTAATAFTMASLTHYNTFQGTIGAGSSITSQVGFAVDATLIAGTYNYGFYSTLNSGTNRYNLYFVGTADNYLAGKLGVGVIPTARNNTTLQIKDGIGFPATQVASSDVNTLDDYEEGTWTPTFIATGSTFSYASTYGYYTKVGNKVTVTCTITLNGAGNTLLANQMSISGLPFTSSASAGSYFAGTGVWQNLASSLYSSYGQIAPSSTVIALFKNTAAATTSPVMLANDLSATAGSIYNITITYFTA